MKQDELVKLARVNFKVFIKLVMPEFVFSPFHHLLAETLEKAVKRETGYTRICLSVPPRHGKSLLCSELLPAWAIGFSATLGNTEDVMALSYGAELAEEFGVKVREICQSKTYKLIFPETSIEDDVATGGRKIKFPNKSMYRATGILGGVTGKPAKMLIIDDPIKNREQAESKVRVKKLQSAFGTDLYSRLEPGAIVIIVHTRWNQKDLIGYVLKQYAHVNWKVIRLAALCDDPENDPLGRQEGEPLVPFRYDRKALLDIKEGLENIADWYALYQNDPIKSGANYWKPNYLNKIELLPLHQYEWIYCTWDCASELNERADYTACNIWGVTNDCIHKIFDKQQRVDFNGLIEFIEEIDREYLPVYHIVEKASNGRAFIQYAEKNLPDLNILAYPAHTKKGQEFSIASSAYKNVYFSDSLPGDQEETLEQLTQWPNVKHDDLAIANLIGMRYFQDEILEGTATAHTEFKRRRPQIYKVETVRRKNRSSSFGRVGRSRSSRYQ